MKIFTLFRHLVTLLVILPMALSSAANAATLNATYDYNRGIFLASDANASYLIEIRTNWNDQSQSSDPVSATIYFDAITGSNVTLPSHVTIKNWDDSWNGQTVPVTHLYGSHTGGDEWYAKCKGEYTLTIPSTITNISSIPGWRVDDWRVDNTGGMDHIEYPVLTFEGITPPFVEGIYVVSKCFVPNEALNTYRQKCAENVDGWNSSLFVLPSEESVRNVIRELPVSEGVSLASQIADAANNYESEWYNTYNLKITGTLSRRDLNDIKEFKNLLTLDLTGATFESFYGCEGLKCLNEVKLPPATTVIEERAFYGCAELNKINTSSITKIGNSAFYGCAQLSSIDIAKVDSIGESAFYDCWRLATIDLSKISNIAHNTFFNCYSLSDVDLSKITIIGGYAFENCISLKNLTLTDIQHIEGEAFSGCTGLAKITFGKNLQSLGAGCFNGISFKEFTIPANVQVYGSILRGSEVEKLYVRTNNNRLSYYVFQNMDYLTDVYLFDPFPGQSKIDAFGHNVTLHVPGFNIMAYKDNDNYFAFRDVVPLDRDIESLNLENSFITISSNQNLGSKFDLSLNGMASSLTNMAPSPLSVGAFTQYGRKYFNNNYGYDNYSEHDYMGGTLINSGSMTADNVSVSLSFEDGYSGTGSGGGWQFISFPYNINITDIVTPNEALWVVRQYNGATRANRSETGDNAETQSAWENVPAATQLSAKKGYILHFSSNNGSEFTFPSADATRNNIFASNDAVIPLEYHPSAYPHNASWNLVGNPYDCFFHIAKIKAANPVITVWRPDLRTYESFSIVEDDYVLTPFEAFFTQGTKQDDSMTFLQSGRFHSKSEAKNADITRAVTRASADRAVVNLHLTGNGVSDRTRLVINPEASTEYELTCDASKFMSMDESVPQIFMMQDGQRLSINERPMGVGRFRIGAYFGAPGEYKVSVDTRDCEYSLTLVDNVTGKETDITEQEYIFNAKAGLDDNRFMLVMGPKAGVDEIPFEGCEINVSGNTLSVDSDVPVQVYSTAGVLVASAQGSLEAELTPGIYVVKAGLKTVKVVIGR